jgi:hypothetical protein
MSRGTPRIGTKALASLEVTISRTPHLAPPPTFRRLIRTYNPEKHQISTTYITAAITLRNITKL